MNPNNVGDISTLSDNDNPNAGHLDSLVIIGGGTMGQGIAISAARRGIEVLLIEKDDESSKKSVQEIEENLNREISRWAMTESEKKAILSRIVGSVEFIGTFGNALFQDVAMFGLLGRQAF